MAGWDARRVQYMSNATHTHTRTHRHGLSRGFHIINHLGLLAHRTGEVVVDTSPRRVALPFFCPACLSLPCRRPQGDKTPSPGRPFSSSPPLFSPPRPLSIDASPPPPKPKAMASLIRSLAALALFLSSASALQVAPGSSCASVCLDRSSGDASDPKASSIKASDVVCNDVDYWSSSIGVKFRTCVECLQNSTKADSSESDTAWYLCEYPVGSLPTNLLDQPPLPRARPC